MKKLIALFTLGILVSSCSTQGENTEIKDCLYASVIAYPTWNIANGPVLEKLNECKNLSVQQRTQLRSDVTLFVNRMVKES